jgi:hypothetical protein
MNIPSFLVLRIFLGIKFASRKTWFFCQIDVQEFNLRKAKLTHRKEDIRSYFKELNDVSKSLITAKELAPDPELSYNDRIFS